MTMQAFKRLSRQVLLLLLGVIGPVVRAAEAAGGESTEGTRPPNIVLIISDDQAWNDYGFMGHPHIRTPHLDRLAEQSLCFPYGYVPSSLCCPSLATMITGLFPWQHGITGNEPPRPEGVGYGDPDYRKQVAEMIGFIDDVPTLPRLLKERGYVSFQSGKWWLGPAERGGFASGMTHGDPDRGGRHGDEGLAIGREGMEPVFDFIRDAGDRPFFLWYAPFLPHAPHNPPERLLAQYRDRVESIHIARYWAMCAWFDETCGALLGFLDEQGLTEETLVVYVTDNGWINLPDAQRYAPRSKRSPYEGGIRTPMMLRWPGRITPRRSEDLAQSIDIAPTVLRAVGLDIPAAMQGINLLDAEAVGRRDMVSGDIYLHNAVDIRNPARNLLYRYCVTKEWKLILPEVGQLPQARPELYRIRQDPLEERDMAQAHPQVVETLKAKLDAWWLPVP